MGLGGVAIAVPPYVIHPQTAVLGRAGGGQRWNRWERGLEGGLEGGYEPCAPFLTRQERGLEEGWKGATSLALLF